jgi:hypothetical protein
VDTLQCEPHELIDPTAAPLIVAKGREERSKIASTGGFCAYGVSLGELLDTKVRADLFTRTNSTCVEMMLRGKFSGAKSKATSPGGYELGKINRFSVPKTLANIIGLAAAWRATIQAGKQSS